MRARSGRRATWIGALGLAGALALLAHRYATPHQASPAVRPFTICVARKETATPTSAGLSEHALAAALRAATDEERARLGDALNASVSARERRVNPLLEDLEGGDPDAPLTAWAEHAPPSFALARTAARTTACAADGFCALVTSRACPGPPTDARDRDRARFLAWPYGYAIVLRARSPHEAREASRRLRDAARRSRWIGLVLAPDDLTVARHAPLDELRNAWLRREALEAISQNNPVPVPAEGAGANLALGELDVIVLPRLEAITRFAELEAEVRAAAPSLDIVP